MDTEPVLVPSKKGGKQPFFSTRIEDEIARRYFVVGETADALAEEFKPSAPKGKLSPSAIRAIARRAAARQATEKKKLEGNGQAPCTQPGSADTEETSVDSHPHSTPSNPTKAAS